MQGRILRAITIAVLATVLAPVSLPGAATDDRCRSRLPEDALRERLSVVLSDLDEVGVLGSALSVSRPGCAAIVAAHGYADRGHGEAVRAEHLFQIGSQTKMFVAASILLLQRQGKLDIDDPVSDHVDGVPRPGELTLRHLLLHTGGIGDGISFFDPPLGRRPSFEVDFPHHLFLGQVAGEQFAPGSGWTYNNLGFVILGRVIESASGQPLDRYVRASILEPLGMDETFSGALESYPVGRMARGYLAEGKDGELTETTSSNLSWASSAGDMISSLRDMRRFAEALLDENNAIGLSLRDYLAATTPVENYGQLERYGFGMMERNVAGQRLWGHGGFIHGYVTMTLVHPESDIVIQFMSNLDDAPPNLIPRIESVIAIATNLGQLSFGS